MPPDPPVEIRAGGDPTQELLTILGRFQRQIARAEAGAEQDEWAGSCIEELVSAAEIAAREGWGEIVDALAGIGRVLRTYESAGYAHLCVPFLSEGHEILCLMVGDLIVGSVRVGVLQKWRSCYAMATEEIEAAGLRLADDQMVYADEARGYDEASSADRGVSEEDLDMTNADAGGSGIAPEVAGLLDALCDDLASLESGERLDLVTAAVREKIAALDAETQEGSRGHAAALCQRAAELVEAVSTAGDEVAAAFLDVMYGFCEAFAEAHNRTDSPEVTNWDNDARRLIDEVTAQAGVASAPQAWSPDRERAGMEEGIGSPMRSPSPGPLPEPTFELGPDFELGPSFLDQTTADEGDVKPATGATVSTVFEPEPVEALEPPERGIDPALGPQRLPATPGAEIIARPDETCFPESATEEAVSGPGADEPSDARWLSESNTHAAVAESIPGPQESPVSQADHESLQALLKTAQQAFAEGKVFDAKLLALEAAASLARLETRKAEALVRDAEQRLADGGQAIEDARGRVSAAERGVREAEEAVADGTRCCSEAEAEVQQALAQRAEVDRRIIEIDDQIRALQERREAEVVQAVEADAEAERARDACAQAEKQLDERRDAEQQARVRLEETRQEVKILQHRRTEIESALEHAREMLGRQSSSSDGIEKTISQIRGLEEALPGDQADLLF
ncbi:MAG TPA: hypothetical protein PLO37_16735 [Candidatus Hydrogenedentes bacterium]|nr:hypothetical protein [Candidatus Hydrogenedentota bacterium]HPG68493.1 hypothetical protein [Candidatus Hydrogenedentota bacterium]